MTVRPAVEMDLPAITAIYNEAVLRSTGTFDTEPKSVESQAKWFAAHRGPTRPVLVAEEGGVVAGWASLSDWSERCAYARSTEISVYIAEGSRGRGLGGALLDAALAAGRAAGVSQILARITGDNEASLRLHRKRGFVEAGLLKRVGEKFGQVLDVHILQLSLEAR